MDYTKEQLEKIRALDVATLKEFIRICEKYDLAYFAIAGTAIGAVRHKGFIPWDDDLDVGMLRPDYDKFLQVAPQEMGDAFECYSAPVQKQVQGFYTQMFPKGSLFITRRNTRWKLHPGIKIDIFPYDNIPAAGQERQRLYRKQRFWNRLYIIRNTKAPILGGDSLSVKLVSFLCKISYYIMKVCGPSIDTIVKKYDRLMRAYTGMSQYYTIMDDMHPDQWYIKEEELYPFRQEEFEGILINVPYCNHEILTRHYGNYMEFPPEEERVGHDVVKLQFPEEMR